MVRNVMVNVSGAAKRLQVTPRHVYRMVDYGWLARPTLIGSRNYWTPEDLDLADFRRKLPRPPASGTRLGIEKKKDGAELARAFLACWQACGLSMAVGLVRAEGAERPGQLPRGVHARLSMTLRRAAALGYVLPP